MIERSVRPLVERSLDRHPVVGLLGPRQVGKTTLAHRIAARRPHVYLDLEAAPDRARLAENAAVRIPEHGRRRAGPSP